MTLRHIVLVSSLFTALLPLPPAAQETDSTGSSIQFDARILDAENPGSSGLAERGDTVLFRLYYVDVACSRFEYFFRQEGNTLTIRRLTMPPDTCVADSEMVYGVEGSFVGVQPGKYLIELRSMISGRDEVLWHDVAVVGRPTVGRKGKR